MRIPYGRGYVAFYFLPKISQKKKFPPPYGLDVAWERFQMILELNSAHPGDLGLRRSCRHCREIVAVGLRQNTTSFFAVAGPKLWNVLPADMTGMVNPRAFKRALTKWCLGRPDRPPVAG